VRLEKKMEAMLTSFLLLGDSKHPNIINIEDIFGEKATWFSVGEILLRRSNLGPCQGFQLTPPTGNMLLHDAGSYSPLTLQVFSEFGLVSRLVPG
jgi:hypothetical protein